MKTTINVQEWLIQSAKQLHRISDFSNLEAQVILAHVKDCTREWLFAHPDELLSEEEVIAAEGLIARLKTGEPLAYLSGKRAFYGREFCVSADVLIPRPETEQLVEECVHWLKSNPQKRLAADVGTGSGIIAISLACQFNDLKIIATDLSKAALEIARANAIKHEVNGQINFQLDDLLSNQSGRFDLIAANLPYVPAEKLKHLAVSKFEPNMALNGGEDGLDLIKRLILQSQDRINTNGLIILEIEEGQAASLVEWTKKQIPGHKIDILNDLAKRPRFIKIYY